MLELTALGRAVYRGQDYPVVYAGIEGRVDLELMRRVLVWVRNPLAWKSLREKADGAHGLASTVMWMLKGICCALVPDREIGFRICASGFSRIFQNSRVA